MKIKITNQFLCRFLIFDNQEEANEFLRKARFLFLAGNIPANQLMEKLEVKEIKECAFCKKEHDGNDKSDTLCEPCYFESLRVVE